MYLPSEISLAGGRVLKLIYSAPFSTAGVGNRLTTVVLDSQAVRAEGGRCRGEGRVRTGQGCLEEGSVEHITQNDLDFILELLDLLGVGITGNGTDLVLLGELCVVQQIVDG